MNTFLVIIFSTFFRQFKFFLFQLLAHKIHLLSNKNNLTTLIFYANCCKLVYKTKFMLNLINTSARRNLNEPTWFELLMIYY